MSLSGDLKTAELAEVGLSSFSQRQTRDRQVIIKFTYLVQR